MAKSLPTNNSTDMANLSVKVATLSTDQKSSYHTVPLTSLILNDKNTRYRNIDSQEGQTSLEALKSSIEERGLYHPLVVYAKDGKYVIMAGERRYRAISMIKESERSKLFPQGIPCVIYKNISEIEEQIIIDEANILVRQYDEQKTLEIMDNLCQLYEIKEGKDKSELKPLIKERIRQILSIGERTANTLVRYVELIPEFKEAVQKKEISLEELSGVTAFCDMDQKYLFNVYEITSSVSSNELEFLRKQRKALRKVQDRAVQKAETLSLDEEEKKAFIDLKVSETSEKQERERKERLTFLMNKGNAPAEDDTNATAENKEKTKKKLVKLVKDLKSIDALLTEDQAELRELIEEIRVLATKAIRKAEE